MHFFPTKPRTFWVLRVSKPRLAVPRPRKSLKTQGKVDNRLWRMIREMTAFVRSGMHQMFTRRSIAAAGIVVAFCLLGSGCRRHSDNPQFPAPALLISPEVLDFGPTHERVLEQQLSVTNRSNSVVCISDIDRSCGCTVAGLDLPCDVRPGLTVTFPVKLSYSPDFRGSISQKLTLRTNDPIRAEYVIPISATLKSKGRVALLPDIVNFGKIGAWESPRRAVRICYGEDDATLSVKGIKPGHSEALLMAKGRGDDGCLEYDVTIPKVSAGINRGPFRDVVVFETSHGTIPLEIIGERMGPIYCTSNTLVCEDLKGECAKSILLIHSPDAPPLTVSADCDIANPVVREISAVSPGKTRVQVALSFRKSELPEHGLLKLTTGICEEPVLLNIYTRK